MVSKIAEHPFYFTGCSELREMVGRSARDEQQLLEAIEEIPSDSLFQEKQRLLSKIDDILRVLEGKE